MVLVVTGPGASRTSRSHGFFPTHSDMLKSSKDIQRDADGVSQKYEKVEIEKWHLALQAYRLQQWDISNQYLQELIAINPSNMMYAFYLRRIALLRLQPLNPSWDGTSDFS